jgi:hypothetical protein
MKCSATSSRQPNSFPYGKGDNRMRLLGQHRMGLRSETSRDKLRGRGARVGQQILQALYVDWFYQVLIEACGQGEALVFFLAVAG